MRRVLSILLILVGVVLLAVAGGIFIKAQLGYKQAKDTYDKIASTSVSDATDSDPAPITVDFNSLGAGSENVVGWIYVPGTVINYPVAQGKDNEQYLRHLPDGTYNDNGTIFMDMDDTAPGMVDQQTTIYGHHMNDGSMFKYIDNTMNQEDFDKVTDVYYITRDAVYLCKPLFTMQVPDTYGDARTPNFTGSETLTQYLQNGLAQAKAKASDADQRIPETKQVLTLVTCAGEIIPRTTRAAMVCELVKVTSTSSDSSSSADSTNTTATAATTTETTANPTA